MQNNLVLVAALFLVGCTTSPTIKTVVQRVEIPIAIPCKAQAPVKPEFNFGKLSEEQAIDEKAKALLNEKHKEHSQSNLLRDLKDTIVATSEEN